MSIISPRVARWSLPRNCLASGSFVFIKRPSRSGASDFGTALNRFLRICLRSKIAFSSSALKLRFSCRTMAARIAAYRALSAEVGPCGSLMPGSISGGVMISPGVPPYPRCLLSRGIGRTAGRPLSRIALCGRKIVLSIRTVAGAARPTPAAAGCVAAATATQGSSGPPAAAPPQRLVRAHLFAKLQSIGLPLVAATNCVRHSAAPIV